MIIKQGKITMADFTVNARLAGILSRVGRIFFIGLLVTLSQTMIVDQAKASEVKKEESGLSRESYVNVPPFVVTMYHNGRPKGNMTITVLVKVVDSEKRATARKYLPRLNSAYVMEASRLSHDYFDVRRPVNVAMLGDALQAVTNKVLGHRQSQLFISNVIINNR